VTRVRGGALAATIAVALTLGVGGCGGGSSPTPSDLATVVPADARVYVEASVRPQGATKDALDDALSKLLGTRDPAAMVTRRLDQELGKTGLSYDEDVAPWLGEQAGAFYQSLGVHPTGAVLAQTTNAGATEATFKKGEAADHKKVTSSTHAGVEVQLAGRDALATVGGIAVIGSREGVEAAIDASKGASLSDSRRFRSSLAGAPSDRVFTAWADPRRIIDSVASSGKLSGPQVARIRSQFGSLLSEPVAAWGDATSDYLAVELSLGAPSNASPASTSLISGFPDDAWFAFGASGFGQGFARGLEQLESQQASQLGNSSAFLDRVRQALGVDVGNIGKWLGDVSGYVGGTSIIGLGGAIVLQSRDEDASAKSLAQLQTAFEHDVDVITRPLGGGRTGFSVTPQGSPVQFVFEQRGGKVVAGLGQDSVDQALNPPSTLGHNGTFKTAIASLNGLPATLYLDFQPISTLLDIPGISTNPNLQLAKPYLDRLDYLVAGGGVKDGRLLARLVLGVKSGAASSSAVASTGGPPYAAVMR
jgi:hypothetical protein